MWIPHFGYALWEQDGLNCKKSDADKKKREFIVSFFLEDTDERNVNDSNVSLIQNEERMITIFVGKKPDHLPVLFEANEKQRLKVIRCKVKAKNKLEAVSKAYNPIARTLSFWSVAESSATNIWALAVTDEKYKANWVARPQSAQPFNFNLPKGISFDKKFNAVFSLYREGRTSKSPYYRFFCFAKILESFYAQGEIFKGANEILKKHGESPKKVRGEKKIDREQLVYALAWPKFKELEGLKYTKFWGWIRDNYRHLVGHAFPSKYTEEQWLDLDEFQNYTDFAIIGNIVDLVVKGLIKDELDLYQKFAEKGYIKIEEPKDNR